jgi:NAD(P)-dependent dehydrogenase (short-subunit alcohol dehydrogenase family)
MTRIAAGLSPFTDAADIAEGHDLSGRNMIVTGGATGIGIETTRALAAAGAEVMIAVRNRKAGEDAAAQINGQIGADRVSVGALDLSDLASVAAFVRAWGDRPLHVLINNAGVMACPQTYTANDLEMQIGTNHFGHYLMTVPLAAALEAGAKASGKTSRLVSLSSIGHRRSGIRWDDPHFRTGPYDKWESYGQAKTANADAENAWVESAHL